MIVRLDHDADGGPVLATARQCGATFDDIPASSRFLSADRSAPMGGLWTPYGLQAGSHGPFDRWHRPGCGLLTLSFRHHAGAA